MQLNKICIGLALSATFGLIACGDDSSSASPDNTEMSSDSKGDSSTKPTSSSSGEPAAEETSDYNLEGLSEMELTTTLDILSADKKFFLGTLDECTTDRNGEKAEISAGDKSYTATCKNKVWETPALDSYINAIADKLAANQKEKFTGEGCDFSLDDNTWVYRYKELSTGYTYEESVSHTADTLVRLTTTIEYETNCQYVDASEERDSKGLLIATEKCEQGTYYRERYMYQSGYDDSKDREELFERTMNTCQQLNGNFLWQYTGK